MCGICGFAATEPGGDGEGILQRMNDSLRHRGPDDEGCARHGGVLLAMRRLAIIDLQTGHQPIATPDGQVHIVYNGELYNFPSLRLELEALGIPFRTSSDTEVILSAYRQWGPACLERLNGMFAVAIADAGGTLFLARDRFGEKPLYYYHDPTSGLLVFGSEIKALLRHPAVPRRIDPEAIPLYLTHGYVPAPDTIYAGIRELPPAHYLTWRQGRARLDQVPGTGRRPSGACRQWTRSRRPRRCGGGWQSRSGCGCSATCRSGRFSVAAWIPRPWWR